MIEIPETFIGQETNRGRLIQPGFAVGNHTWKDWKLRWLRSLHVRSDGSIISMGFPKFMNLGEGNDKYRVEESDLLKRAGKDLYATLKIDGSLLIRYVDDNDTVQFRTRGSLQVGLDNAYELDDFCKQYPRLRDPEFYPNQSILFEWVSPANKIVIIYKNPGITLIGGVRYSRKLPWWDAQPRLFTIKELHQVARDLEVPMVHAYSLRTESGITQLIKDLETNQDIEGFVLRFDKCQRMVKVKADHYLTLHALRSNLTTARLIDLWLQWGKPEWAEYQKHFETAYDWECWNWAMPAVSALYDGLKVALRIRDHVMGFVEENKDLCRKDFALLAQEKYNGINLSLCFMGLDGKEVPEHVWKKLILQNCKQVEMRMFEET